MESIGVCDTLYTRRWKYFFEYINSYITKTLTSGVYGIYWYIYLIVGLYIITPFLRKICKDKNICIYTITIIYTFYVVQRIFPEVAVCNRFSCDNLLYIGYYITGYAINKYFKQYKGFKITSILLLISFITTYIFVSLIIKHLGIGGVNYINDILIIIISISIFSTLININIRSNQINKALFFISKTSYGIYLTHFIFISILVKFPFMKTIPIEIEPFVMVIMVLACETLMMYIIQKTKLNNWLF